MDDKILKTLGYKVGDYAMCKKYFFYNTHIFKGNVFKVISTKNRHNIRIRSQINTYHIIPYIKRDYSNLAFNELFYTKAEFRKIKIQKIINNKNK